MKRAAVAGVAVSTAVLALAYALAFVPAAGDSVPAALLSVGTAGILAATLALGAQRDGRLGVLWIPVVFVFLIVAGGMLTLLAMAPVDPADPDLVLGLPRPAALLLYGVGLLPTLVVPVVYALTFERLTLGADELERIRARRGDGSDAEQAP